MSGIYEIRELSFSYPSSAQKVLNGVSLEVSEGEVISVLGRNGAGKSTLIACMLGLLRPQSGEILLCGKNLRKSSPRELAASVGYVPQSHVPVFGHTVFDFVLMGCASRIGFFSHPGKKDREDTEAALDKMGIAPLSDRPYTELSGGERQQALIARAIVAKPRVVLFDEPTAHLDFGNQLRVLRVIKGLAEAGFAVVITTHNPDHALLLGGRTAIIGPDCSLVCGKTEELVTEASLKSVYGSDLRLEYIPEFDRKVCVYPNL